MNKIIVPEFRLKRANRFLPYILLVGLGIGMANFIMNGGLNLIQWIIQSLSTSFIIGYSTVVIASNKPWIKAKIQPAWKMYISLLFIYLLAAVLATEVEHLIRSLVFQSESFHLFSASKMYLFNGIISSVLGFSLFQNSHIIHGGASKSGEKDLKSISEESDQSNTLQSSEEISNIPVKKGDNVLLVPVNDIVYFEANDNYSFLYDLNGNRRLCDYSLLFLEKRLDKHFLRIHRKYLVNEQHIKQIRPHINGRFVIEFSPKELSSVTSSKTYSANIRKLTKIE